MGGFTILLIGLLLVLYLYLFLVRKDLIFTSKRRTSLVTAIPFLAVGGLLLTIHEAKLPEDYLRGIIAALFILSFLFDSKGLGQDRIVNNSMDLRGVPYNEVERVVLLATPQQTKMNFFRHGMRGPLLIFDVPVEEIALFLSEHLPKGTAIEILLMDSDEGKK